ncbi:LysR family transcriptional regulator, positive regulator for ilvC [Desulfocicer vacuolatum DSM 3385]|uniref:LysR family transcriptional regulator, positive regulator for ilvC n=1 Tax=Desulfocicer vacuolatum DSM 3385 TaxID=1121400 RepID=A0A1W2A2A7_9BACT|nr:HTH-type transcriptional activator IlvY [Desulfocicer vacuolatum]SMC54733.1 LysR family transcriptional regulator, positive regulator for ilvC [Desulfocicer vacuolatum DSM 3385]
MDIRELQTFRHLAHSLHFGKTSRACHMTPSALTRMIQRMENRVGQSLFTRDNRSVTLTCAGKALLGYAEDVSRRWVEFQNDLSAIQGLVGKLSIYGSVTAVYGILSSILFEFRRMHPAVQINLETGDAAKALTKLWNEEVDISIAALPGKMPQDLAYMKVTETPLVFIAPSKFPNTVIYSGSTVNWEKTPLIMPDQGLSRQQLDQWLNREEIRANIYAQVAGNEAIIAMVSLGCGVAVVPQLVLEKSPLYNEVKILKNTPALTPFSIGICALKKNISNPKIKALWGIAANLG